MCTRLIAVDFFLNRLRVHATERIKSRLENKYASIIDDAYKQLICIDMNVRMHINLELRLFNQFALYILGL